MDLVLFKVFQMVPMHIPVGESHFGLLKHLETSLSICLQMLKCCGSYLPVENVLYSFFPGLSILVSFSVP